MFILQYKYIRRLLYKGGIMNHIQLTSEIEEKCCVARGVKGSPAPIPQEGQWTK